MEQPDPDESRRLLDISARQSYSISTLQKHRSDVLEERKTMVVVEREAMQEQRKLQQEQAAVIDKLVHEVMSLRSELAEAQAQAQQAESYARGLQQKTENSNNAINAAIQLQVTELQARLEAEQVTMQQLRTEVARLNDDKTFLSRSLGELEHTQTQLSALLQSSDATIQEQKLQLEKERAAHTILQQEYANVQARYEEMIVEMATVTTDKATLRTEISVLTQAAREAHSVVAEQQAGLRQLAEERDEAMQQLANKTKELAEVRTLADMAEQRHQSYISSMQSELQKESHKQRDATVELREQLSAAHLAHTMALEEIAKLQAVNQTLHDEMGRSSTALKSRVEDLEKSLEMKAQSLAQAETQLAGTQRQNAALENQNKALQERLHNLDKSMTARLQESSAVLGVVENAARETEFLQHELERKSLELHEMQVACATQQQDIEAMKRLMATKDTKAEELNTRLSLAQDELTRCQAAMQARAGVLSAELQQVTAAYESALHDANQERAAKDAMVHQLEQAMLLVEEVRAKVHDTSLNRSVADAQNIHVLMAEFESIQLRAFKELLFKVQMLEAKFTDLQHVWHQRSADIICDVCLPSGDARDQAEASVEATHGAPAQSDIRQDAVGSSPADHNETTGMNARAREALEAEVHAPRGLVDVEAEQNLQLKHEVLLLTQLKDKYAHQVQVYADRAAQYQDDYEKLRNQLEAAVTEMHGLQEQLRLSVANAETLVTQNTQLLTDCEQHATQRHEIAQDNMKLKTQLSELGDTYFAERQRLESALQQVQQQLEAAEEAQLHLVQHLSTCVPSGEDTEHQTNPVSADRPPQIDAASEQIAALEATVHELSNELQSARSGRSKVQVLRTVGSQTSATVGVQPSGSPAGDEDSVSADASDELILLKKKVSVQSRALVAAHRREMEVEKRLQELTRIVLKQKAALETLGHASPTQSIPRWNTPLDGKSSQNGSREEAHEVIFSDSPVTTPLSLAAISRKTAASTVSGRSRVLHESISSPPSTPERRKPKAAGGTPKVTGEPLMKGQELVLHNMPGPGQTVRLIARCEFYPSGET